MRSLLIWIGVFLLASAQLLASEFFGVTRPAIWLSMLGVGALCCTAIRVREVKTSWYAVAALLAVPSVFVLGFPAAYGSILVIAGLLMAPVVRGVGTGLATGGALWLVQSLTVFVYGSITSRAPMLPDWIVETVAYLGKLSGAQLGVDGSNLVIFSMRAKHAIAGTWAWFADPATVGFVVSGALALLVAAPVHRVGRALAFVFLAGIWLFARSTLSIGIYMHTALVTDYDSTLDVATQLWNPWFGIGMLAPLVLLAAWLVPLHGARDAGEENRDSTGLPLAPIVVSALASILLVFGYLWHPNGDRKKGRVLVNEYHSTVDEWSKWMWSAKEFDTTGTLRPYDTEWYGEAAAYNYASLYEYCSRFYDIDRLTGRIDDAALEGVDVFVVKVPSKYFTQSEVEAVHRFVENGGGLLLVGEHTTVFGSGVTLNQIAREYGFEFRYDCVFGIDSVFKQSYEPWLVPHPASQHMGPMEMAISCSIDPGTSSGTAVLRGIGLKNKDSDYFAPNAYPQTDDVADMVPGSFVQAWATEHNTGEGRVLAFTDSTIMANFSFFEPGKSELFLGMVEWLNHEQGMGTRWLAILGILAACLALGVLVREPALFVPMLGACTLGTAASVWAVQSLHASSLPFPERVRPVVAVGFDRSICTAIKLPASGFIGGKAGEYGLFERSVQRLTKPKKGSEPGLPWISRRVEALDGDLPLNLVVLIQPVEEPSAAVLQNLERYVKEGGHLLVLDAHDNDKSTANVVLATFDMKVRRDSKPAGEVAAPGFPKIVVASSLLVEGGHAWARVGDAVIGASKAHGKGSVHVVGFGTRFSDPNMGITGDVIPSDEVKRVYEFEYALLRRIHGGELLSK